MSPVASVAARFICGPRPGRSVEHCLMFGWSELTAASLRPDWRQSCGSALTPAMITSLISGCSAHCWASATALWRSFQQGIMRLITPVGISNGACELELVDICRGTEGQVENSSYFGLRAFHTAWELELVATFCRRTEGQVENSSYFVLHAFHSRAPPQLEPEPAVQPKQ